MTGDHAGARNLFELHAMLHVLSNCFNGLTTRVVPFVVGATTKVRSAEFYSSGSRASYNWLCLISNDTLIVVSGT